MAGPAPIIVALDWTPNTNHTGFFVAKEKGWYQEEGLDVKLLSPHVDGYKKTPASRVTDRTATFALAPSETVISNYTSPDKDNLLAVATLLQDDLSAIVTLKSNGISRPKDLDGKNYASYGARYEGRIVQSLIKADGGSGDFIEDTPEKLGIWETLLKGGADATWVFRGWEGVEAQLKGVELNEFVLKDYGIPYGYSPVVVAHVDTLKNKPEVVKAFLRATAKGFKYAAENVELAASILEDLSKKEEPPLEASLDPGLVLASQRVLSQHYLTSDGKWGVQSDSLWNTYLDWLSKEGLLTTARQSRDPVEGVSASLDDLRAGKVGEQIPREKVPVGELFTNEYLS